MIAIMESRQESFLIRLWKTSAVEPVEVFQKGLQIKRTQLIIFTDYVSVQKISLSIVQFHTNVYIDQ